MEISGRLADCQINVEEVKEIILEKRNIIKSFGEEDSLLIRRSILLLVRLFLF